MKAVIPVGAAEVRSVVTTNFCPSPLCHAGFSGVNRVGVSELSQSFFWIDLVRGVERNEERLGAVQPLKNIHTVGDQGQVLIAAFSGEKVPAGPGEFAAWHEAVISMENDAVFLVAHGAQYLLLQITRILQQLGASSL